MMKAMVIACAVLGVAGLAACEKAGEDMDTAIEKIGDGKANPGDGALEKAGEGGDDDGALDGLHDRHDAACAHA